MSRPIFYVAGLLIVLFLSSAGGLEAQKVSTEYDPERDFSAFRTFAWLPEPAKPADHPLAQGSPIDRGIREAIESHLERRGLQKAASPEQADLLLSYAGALYDRIGLPDRDDIWSSGGVKVGPDESLVGTTVSYKEGNLVLDMYASDGETVVWSGSASDIGSERAWLRDAAKRAARMARKIVQQFPPR